MIKDILCNEIDVNHKNDLLNIFTSSFDSTDPENNIDYYLSLIERILILYTPEGNPTAFLFYQQREIEGYSVLQFSLSGKVGEEKNVQKRLGSYLFFKYVISFKGLFRLTSFVTISNNPRSYYNMISLGGQVFPNVLKPNEEFKFSQLYQRVASDLGGGAVDERGILRNRMQELNFNIKTEQSNMKAMDRRGIVFMDYIDKDVSNGVLVLVCCFPILDIPRYYINSLIKKIKYLKSGKRVDNHSKNVV